MPFDSNGSFNRLRSWVSDAAANIKIRADYHDTHDSDLAAGLSSVITKDGRTQPTANIPMNQKKLINLGEPTVPTDAATKNYVDTLKTFTTGMTISGADANGMVNFTSATGSNGLSFTGADLSWVARLTTASPHTSNRLAFNDKPDASGSDLFFINDSGHVNFSNFIGVNYHHDGSVWRTIAAGFTTFFSLEPTTGFFRYYTNPSSLAANTTSPIAAVLSVSPAGALSVSSTINAGGAISAGGRVSGTDVLSQSNVYAASGAAYLGTDGNIIGSVWDNFGAHDAYSAINARIESRAQTWANDRVSNLQYRRTSLGAVGLPGSGAGTTDCPAGAVLCGMSTNAYYPTTIRWVYLQVYDPVRGWVGFSG